MAVECSLFSTIGVETFYRTKLKEISQIRNFIDKTLHRFYDRKHFFLLFLLVRIETDHILKNYRIFVTNQKLYIASKNAPSMKLLIYDNSSLSMKFSAYEKSALSLKYPVFEISSLYFFYP